MLIRETNQSGRDSQGSKLDPRVKRTRKLLQQAFKELSAEKTFNDITVQDITDRAEVNRATFYAHFEDKYALCAYVVRENLQNELDKRLPDDPPLTLANLRLLAVAVNDFMGIFIGHCLPTSPEYLNVATQVQQHLYQLLLEWLSKAKNTPDRTSATASPETIATTLSWIIYGTALQSAQATPRASMESIPDQALDDAIRFLTPSLQAYFA